MNRETETTETNETSISSGNYGNSGSTGRNLFTLIDDMTGDRFIISQLTSESYENTTTEESSDDSETSNDSESDMDTEKTWVMEMSEIHTLQEFKDSASSGLDTGEYNILSIHCENYNEKLPEMIGWTLSTYKLEEVKWNYLLKPRKKKQKGFSRVNEEENTIYHAFFVWPEDTDAFAQMINKKFSDGLVEYSGVAIENIKQIFMLYPYESAYLDYYEIDKRTERKLNSYGRTVKIILSTIEDDGIDILKNREYEDDEVFAFLEHKKIVQVIDIECHGHRRKRRKLIDKSGPYIDK